MVYLPPEINGHNVPYKGKRYWVIEVDADHPFEWVDSETANFAVYDKSMRYVIATVQLDDDGRYWVQMATHCESALIADDLKDAAQSAGKRMDYMTAKGWG